MWELLGMAVVVTFDDVCVKDAKFGQSSSLVVARRTWRFFIVRCSCRKRSFWHWQKSAKWVVFFTKNFCKSSAVCRVLPLVHINILRIYSCSFICGKYLVLTSENWRKGNDAASIRSPVVGEEIRPGHGLGSALYVFFSALSLLLGWQEEHPACKNRFHLSPKVLRRRKETEVEVAYQVCLVNGP